MLVLASVTDQLWTLASNAVGSLGLAGIFLLMVPESACIPIPSEATMIFAGVNVSHGHYPLWAAVAVGVVANVVGSWIAYAVGYYGRIELVEKHGGKIHVKNCACADASTIGSSSSKCQMLRGRSSAGTSRKCRAASS